MTVRLLVCPDKFRGTLTASEAARAIAVAATAAGITVTTQAVSDGGEGFLECFGGTLRTARVEDALGRPVDAPFKLLDGNRTAVVEMASAAGLGQVGGATGNDPLAASTSGVGRLIAAAVGAGARRLLIGCGGSATTDGGLGAVEALGWGSRLRGVEVSVACDVETPFLEAAEVFGPQKGASPAQVKLLTRRLERVAADYEARLGMDVRPIPRGGAAGGFAGGMAALGADLVSGFDVVADTVDLAELIAESDAVVTGEGLLDAESFNGKAVGGVCGLAGEAGVPVLVVCGDREPGLEAPAGVEVVSLVERVGRNRAEADAAGSITEIVGSLFG